MITGSIGSSFHGPPRATQDADIIINTTEQSLRRFIAGVKGEFYADENMAIDALKTNFMFNIIHLQTGFKIDFIVRKRDAYSTTAFERRIRGEFSDTTGWFSSAEDIILSKLQWHKLSESGRQIEDAVAVAKMQHGKLDIHYMKTWAENLGVEDLLNKVLGAINT